MILFRTFFQMSKRRKGEDSKSKLTNFAELLNLQLMAFVTWLCTRFYKL